MKTSKEFKPFYQVTVVGDTNDCDLVEQSQAINEEDKVKLEVIAKAVKNFKPYKVKYIPNGYPKSSPQYGKLKETTHRYNFPLGDMARKDLGEKLPYEIYPEVPYDIMHWFMYEICPWGQHGIHTLESIHITKISESTKLL